MSKIDYEKIHFGTKVVHAAQGRDPVTGAMATPIYLTSTFGFETIDDIIKTKAGLKKGYAYTRASNPTNEVLENKLAMLEGGEAAAITASGIGAIGATLLSFLHNGDHIICSDGVYGGTDYIMRNNLINMGVEVTFVDATKTEKIKDAIKENTKIIYFETPINPTMRIADIKAISEIGKSNGIKIVVDSTFAPAPIQNALQLGADIVIHSTTKYINGHGDVLGGVIVGTKKDISWIKTYAISKICGTPQNPFASYLTLRGIKTLSLRVRHQCNSAMILAKYLEKHKYIEKVNYPGLESHPQHELAKSQMNGLYTGMLSIIMKDGINGLSAKEAAKKLVSTLKIPTIAPSLGDPDSLLSHSVSMSHDIVPEEERIKVGVTDGLIRISVGLEDIEDLIEDFENALKNL